MADYNSDNERKFDNGAKTGKRSGYTPAENLPENLRSAGSEAAETWRATLEKIEKKYSEPPQAEVAEGSTVMRNVKIGAASLAVGGGIAAAINAADIHNREEQIGGSIETGARLLQMAEALAANIGEFIHDNPVKTGVALVATLATAALVKHLGSREASVNSPER